MTSAIATPLWLAEPSGRRLRDISNVIASRAPRSPAYAASIAEDAAALQKLATEFIRYANAYTSPILRLSPELIFEIFACIAELEPTNPITLGWIRLGHVSHAFRSALLNMRELWASAACNVSYHARDEVLVRAGNTPLFIDMRDASEDIARHRIEFAMGHLSCARRVKILEFDPRNPLWTLEPHVISGQELPLLECLQVEAMHRPQRDATWLSTEVYGLTPLRAPRLKSVFLVNIFIPFPPENLTTLDLYRRKHFPDGSIPNQDAVLPSPQEFLSLLRRCSQLRHLCLEQAIPDVRPLPSTHRSTQGIRLPYLKSISLDAPMSRIAALWSHLALPPDAVLSLKPDYTDIKLAATHDGFVKHERLTFIHLFIDHAALSSLSPITGLALEVDGTRFFTQCSFFRRELDYVVDTWEGVPVYTPVNERNAYVPFIDVWFFQCAWDERTSVGDFISSIPKAFFFGIVAADVAIPGLKQADLLLLFSCLPDLHTLELRKPDSASLTALSSPTTPRHVAQHEPDLPAFHHLHSLGLYFFRLCSTPDKRKGRAVCVHEVYDLLASRARSGLPLQSLVIEGKRFEDVDQAGLDAFITRLRAMVPNVKVVLQKVVDVDEMR
ncbi:hypothetical protein PENSPDRAFT_228373 [Peniophora sp. CONT]|nr:hypothetical protein PENSPDRAFT_228373 [Peniophora sp. CONT]